MTGKLSKTKPHRTERAILLPSAFLALSLYFVPFLTCCLLQHHDGKTYHIASLFSLDNGSKFLSSLEQSDFHPVLLDVLVSILRLAQNHLLEPQSIDGIQNICYKKQKHSRAHLIKSTIHHTEHLSIYSLKLQT